MPVANADTGTLLPSPLPGHDYVRPTGTPVSLRHLSFFAGIPDEELVQIEDAVTLRRFCAGEIVIPRGDRSDTLHAVCRGRLQALARHDAAGRTLALETFLPGDVCAELELLDSRPRSVTVMATEDSEIATIDGAELRVLLRNCRGLSDALLTLLARRIRNATARLTTHSFQQAAWRVCSVLLQLTQTATDPDPVDGGIRIRATHAELAQMAGASRETATRFLVILQSNGVITQDRGSLVVRDREGLRSYLRLTAT